MNKIALVAQREFLTRVKKKTFLLTTILLPLLIFAFYAMIIYFSVDSGKSLRIAVADNANLFKDSIESKDDAIQFQFVKETNEAALREKLKQNKYDAFLFIPQGTDVMSATDIKVVSNESIGIMTQEKVERRINKALEIQRLKALNLNPAQLDSIQSSSNIQFPTLEGDNEKENVAGFSYAVGIISGFIIYIVLFVYGTMVMRGVMEEKVSRIAEVIVSSVKPFQLMLGKILGIGSVGLLQFIIWIVIVSLLPMAFAAINPEMAQQLTSNATNVQAPGTQITQNSSKLVEMAQGLNQLPLGLIAGSFIFYFLGGYLLYSSLFAAVGSAVNEDPQDAQSLLFPIMMPIIFAMAIMMKAANDPNSGLAVFGSLFPLTSPIVMMARLPYNPPAWEIIASYLLLIGGFLFTTWIAAKIYRTGILMYGKKPTWKELAKWAFKRG